MAVVEPETGGADQDSPVGGVERGGDEGEESEGEKRCEFHVEIFDREMGSL